MRIPNHLRVALLTFNLGVGFRQLLVAAMAIVVWRLLARCPVFVASRTPAASWPSCIESSVNMVKFHVAAAQMKLRCNMREPSFAPRQFGAMWSVAMEIAGVVLLGSVVLWFAQQFDRHNW